MEDRLLKIEKVAERLDVSVRQVHRLVEWGHLKAYTVGRGDKRFYERDVDEYLVRLRLDVLPPVPPETKPPKPTKKD